MTKEDFRKCNLEILSKI